MSDYDSDEAPEAVSFAQSKTETLQKFQEASKSVKEEKQRLKEKRKKRDEIFKAQKKEKLERLANLMPTEDELQQLNEELKVKEESTRIDLDAKSGTKKVFDELDDHLDDVLSDEPASKTNFRVINTKRDYERQLESRVADSVLKFRETMLFGAGSKNRREKSEDALRRKQKMKVISKSGKSKLSK